MNPTNQREDEVFYAALNVPDPVQRQRFLDQACGGNSSFRARIESLLAVQPEAERFFDRAALALALEIERHLRRPGRPRQRGRPACGSPGRSGLSQTTREDSAAS